MCRIIKSLIFAFVSVFVFQSCNRNYNEKSSLAVRQNITKGHAISKMSTLKLEGLKINNNFNCLSSQGDSIAFKQIIKDGKFVILYDSKICNICFDGIYDIIRENFSFMLNENMIVFTNYENAKILQIAKQQKMKEVSIFNIKSSFFDEYLPYNVAFAFVTNELIFKDVYVPSTDKEMIKETLEYLKKIKHKYYFN